MMRKHSEIFEGFVVDLACVRKYRSESMLERARVHTRACALMPHCIESGYGLVDEQGRVLPLDPAATPLVHDVLRRTSTERGIRLRAVRVEDDEAMKTVSVDLV